VSQEGTSDSTQPGRLLMTAPCLLVGAAKADITPDYGTQISGDIGRYRPVEEIRDRLYARVFVFKTPDEIVCLLVCDMACIAQHLSWDLRCKIAEVIGGRPEAVMVHCVQSHSAARVGGMFEDPEGHLSPELWWVRGETPAYNQLFTARVLASVAEASDRVVPARVRFARAIDGRCAFNRRFVMRDGSARSHPGYCNEEILHCEGPVDPEASLTLFEEVEGRPLAGLLHFTCHPTHGYPHRYISADWPGLWSERISDKLGAECVVGCLNGACGNIGPADMLDPDYDPQTSLERMLTHLEQTGETLLGRLKAVPELPLRAVSQVTKVPWNQPTPEAVAAARQLLADHPQPIYMEDTPDSIVWEWVFALRDLDKVSRLATNPDYDFEIQAFRIGDVVIVGWPGEPFVEAQLEVKLKSPSRRVLVAHECNDECSYLPTLGAAGRGGYEAWGKLPPGTLESVAEQTIQMIARL
jgi:neutral ceramidase